VFLDNVCLFVSPDPITAPVKVGGVTAQFIDAPRCSQVSAWLSATVGIDFPALEILATTTPSIWDPEDWVPWLASKLYVNILKPAICFVVGIIIPAVNKIVAAFLNIWFGFLSLIRLFITRVFDAVRNLVASLATWLLWLASPFLAIWRLLVGLWESLGGVWELLGSVWDWLIDWIGQALAWLISSLKSWFTNLLNFLITAWNVLLPSIGKVLSTIMGWLAGLWNNIIAPWLGSFGWVRALFDFLLGLLSAAGLLILSIGALVWDMFSMVWDFSTALAGLPLTFYNAFDQAVSSENLWVVTPDCTGDLSGEPFCWILAGMQIVDVAISHSIVYPIVIVGIIIATIVVFWRHVWGLISFDFQ